MPLNSIINSSKWFYIAYALRHIYYQHFILFYIYIYLDIGLAYNHKQDRYNGYDELLQELVTNNDINDASNALLTNEPSTISSESRNDGNIRLVISIILYQWI